MEKNIILCHKCYGQLAGPHTPGLHGCGCISGWVRDWQTPITAEEALKQQAEGRAAREKWRAEREAEEARAKQS